MSTSQPRRSTMSFTSRPRAPQMTARWCSPHGCQLWESEHSDERVVEIRASRQLDVFDARRQLEGDLALAIRQQRDLGAFAGRVPDGDDAVHVDRRDEADDLRALGLQVRAE